MIQYGEVEIWKDIYFKDFNTNEIIDYRGLYQISNFGRIKILERIDSAGRKRKEKIMKPTKKGNGYLHVGLYKNKKWKYFHVHRLVAIMFIQNKDLNKNVIDHIDTNKENNHVNNLRWVSQKENLQNPITKEKVTRDDKGRFRSIIKE